MPVFYHRNVYFVSRRHADSGRRSVAPKHRIHNCGDYCIQYGEEQSGVPGLYAAAGSARLQHRHDEKKRAERHLVAELPMLRSPDC